MLRLDIRGVNAYPLEKEVLTEGRVGLEISFTFSSDWDGLTKIAVFEGAQTIDVILENDRCVVPHEALAQSGAALRIGVYGQNTAGDIVIPTVWAKFGMVQPAAVPSEVSSKPPTPSVVAQILSAAQNAESSASEAERVAQSVRDDADAGEFDGKDGSVIWTTTVAPLEFIPGTFDFLARNLVGGSGEPKVGDLIFYNSYYYQITSIAKHGLIVDALATIRVDIRGGTGPAGADGQDGLDGSAIWKSSAPPTVIQQGGATVILFNLSDLSGPDGHAVQPGDLIFYDSDYYTVGRVSDTTCTALRKTSIKGATGAAGPGVASGGTTGQVLKKKSNTDYDTEWANESGGGGTPYTSNPAALGTASPGSSDNYSRGDHVHPKPSASDIGAIAAPASPSAGDVLTYSSGAWAAQAPASVPSAYTSTPAALGTASAGSSSDYARGDHVHAKPTAADVGAVAVAQGVAHAGEFVVVGVDGNITTVTMTDWQGGNY